MEMQSNGSALAWERKTNCSISPAFQPDPRLLQQCPLPPARRHKQRRCHSHEGSGNTQGQGSVASAQRGD